MYPNLSGLEPIDSGAVDPILIFAALEPLGRGYSINNSEAGSWRTAEQMVLPLA